MKKSTYSALFRAGMAGVAVYAAVSGEALVAGWMTFLFVTLTIDENLPDEDEVPQS